MNQIYPSYLPAQQPTPVSEQHEDQVSLALLEVGSSDERHRHHLGAGEKGRVLGRAPDLQSQKLHLSQVTVCTSKFEERWHFSPDQVHPLCSALVVSFRCFFATRLLLGDAGGMDTCAWCPGAQLTSLHIQRTALSFGPGMRRTSINVYGVKWSCQQADKQTLPSVLQTHGRPRWAWGETDVPEVFARRHYPCPEGRRALPTAAPAGRSAELRGAWQMRAAGAKAREHPLVLPRPAWQRRVPPCFGEQFSYGDCLSCS